jgi:hypothetical protein
MNTQELEAGLSDYYGTEQWLFNPLYPRMKYTDGVKFFAENAGNGAYWFLDIVGTEIHHLYAKREEFINIVLKSDGHKAVITADDGNGGIFWTRKLEYTDCPAGEWQFYLENDVLCLPSER